MDFAPSPRAADLTGRVATFLAEEIEPIEADYHRDLAAARRDGDPWTPLPVLEELKAKARAQGLWNLFLPKEHAGEYAARFGTDGGEGLTNVDYAPIAELTGRSAIAPLVFNCNAPDTGNMEVLLRYGSDAQKARVARAAARRPDPARVRDDRAGRRLLGRDHHGGDRDRRRRRGRHQRPQVVDHRRRQPRLQDHRLHGAHRPRRRPAPPAHDGAGADGHPGREGRADAQHDGHPGRAARARRGVVHRRPGARRQHHLRSRARRSRSPRAGSAPAGCTTACG